MAERNLKSIHLPIYSLTKAEFLKQKKIIEQVR